MIYAHLKHLSAYERKDSDRHEHIDLHSSRFVRSWMTLVARISGFSMLNRSLQTSTTYLRTRETLGALFK